MSQTLRQLLFCPTAQHLTTRQERCQRPAHKLGRSHMFRRRLRPSSLQCRALLWPLKVLGSLALGAYLGSLGLEGSPLQRHVVGWISAEHSSLLVKPATQHGLIRVEAVVDGGWGCWWLLLLLLSWQTHKGDKAARSKYLQSTLDEACIKRWIHKFCNSRRLRQVSGH